MMDKILDFGRAWINPMFRPTALKVSLIVGSVLFAINHAAAVIAGEMSIERWLGAAITYLVPYTVSVHGQFVAQTRAADTIEVIASEPKVSVNS